MSTLLHIDSSPLYGRSVSRELTAAFVTQWKASRQDGRVIDRDLNATALPPINAEWVGAVYTPELARTPQHKVQRVRTHSAWEEWLALSLGGTEITARSAAEAAKQILTLFAKDRDRIQKIGRAASSALRVHEYMQKKPLVGIGAVADELKLSIPTVTVALDHLVRLGIAKEITGKRRARVFGYLRYLKILSEGTEPIQH